MDMTYIPMARGFAYLAAVVDCFSRRVLSWRPPITIEDRLLTDFATLLIAIASNFKGAVIAQFVWSGALKLFSWNV
jgi:transposase InsO family protein